MRRRRALWGGARAGPRGVWGALAAPGRKETATPAGSYNLTWKSKSRRSTDNDAWLLKWYFNSVSYTHLRAHETVLDIVCRLLLEKKNTTSLIPNEP